MTKTYCAAQLAVVVCRAFVELQTAIAHLELFKHIFKIVEDDTGSPVRFRHIHGQGYEVFVADEHKGQGLGKSANGFSSLRLKYI